MKAILVIDVPVLDDGRHLCDECPIWNKERLFCQYDFNMEAKGCPSRPSPKKRLYSDELADEKGNDMYMEGWNACLEEIEKC